MKRFGLHVVLIAALWALAILPVNPAWAFDTGVSDDRVSLPEGPGTLEGVGENVSVNANMGLMQYSVPVRVPQGFEGMTPSPAFSYSSSGGASVLGMGWMMSMPSIERMTMRGVPRYDEDDRFVADGGNELVRVSETIAPSDPAIYRNRFESDFTRYKWVDRAGGQGGYWQVEYADGRVGFFGADANGQIVASAIEAGTSGSFKYHLVEMVDVYDHRVRYTYVKDGSISLVSEIAYVFTNAAPVYQIRFAYEARNDLVWDAKPGFDSILSRRLTGVTVLTRGRQLRRYAVTYQDDAVSGRRSRVQRIESFGANDTRYPVVHDFGYSRGLGAQCEDADCGRPLLVTMVGEEGLGIDLQSGTANLVDINGDALPDLIDGSAAQARHRFFLNRLASNGDHTFADPTTSALGEVSAFAIGNPRVQLIDVNGDGFTDILSGGTTDQAVLLNRGVGDWTALENLAGSSVWTGADAELRFMDYDNDMDIDLIRSSATETFVFENDGAFDFTRQDLSPLGVAFSESIQFTDMNGDGLLDVVQIQSQQLQYKINYGRGRFAANWATLSHPFGAGEFELALVEDIDSDGYADIVVATGNTVRYVLNRNGESFEPVRTLNEASGASLPNRLSTTTVLAADMNGNGSVDIVWVSANGSVRYLDLFPIRSHLLTRIENGIGRVTEIAYQPSVEQQALSTEEGAPWIHPLPYPMTVVSRTDEYDLLTNIHDVTELRYRDGFYDGVERQFRGYAEVTQDLGGDATHGDGREISRYDVGAIQVHLNGQLLFQMRESDGEVVDETTHSFGDATACPVAEVPDNARLVALGRRPIGYACEVQNETVIKEGAASSAWVTTRSSMTYDGYGNVASSLNEGVVAIGGGACEPCDRKAGDFGAACGAQCLGDEELVERTFVINTGGRWLLNKPARERRFGVADQSGLFSEDVYHYDGDDFVGLPEGQLTRGSLTRMTSRIDDTKRIETTRQRFDRHGNSIETLDALGVIGGDTHRRIYTYDEDGLRVARTEILNAAPTPYRLRRTYQYDELFDKVVLASTWMRVEGDTAVTAADPTAYTYDAFGRVESILLPGDTGASPTTEFTYELGNPTTRLITRRRSQSGGALDLETIRCVDGRGRTFQTRQKVKDGEYIVDGFTRYNLRSEPVEVFQSYTSASGACDVAPPTGTRAKTFRYDGVGRLVEITHPDVEVAGGATVERSVYGPLTTARFDGEDTDVASPHHDTPEIETVDGLGRVVATTRQLVGERAVTRLEYDALGHHAGYVDAMGHVKKQTHDAIGRLLRVEDPNAGTTTFTYDDAGNVTERVDARGVTVAYRYDGLNREIERFDPANRDGTLIAHQYDASTDCELSRCPNTAGQLVMVTHPGGADFMGYDVRRRLFSTTRVIEGHTYALETRFDNANRPVERVYPDGRSLEYAFDGASRVAKIDGVIDEVRYTPQGLMDSWLRTSGAIDTMHYDSRLRLSGIDVAGAGGMLQSIVVERDREDNVASVEDGAAGAMMPATVFEYDAWYRSKKIELGAKIETMSFDILDNVLAKGDVTYAYDAARPGAATRIGDEPLTFDPAGAVKRLGGVDHTWDFLGRLVASVGPKGDVRSVFGGDHLRIAQRDDDGVTHYVAHDFEVRDGIAVIYPTIDRTRVARLESVDYASTWLGAAGEDVTAGAAHQRRIAGDADHESWLVAAARKMLTLGRPAVVNLHTDHLGSLALATGDGGALLGRRAFSPFGEIQNGSGYVDRYGFTGQEHNWRTGLIYFAHRALAPSTGQWMSPDPAFTAVAGDTLNRLPEGVARYAYVGNNPGSMVDPDGRSKFGWVGRLVNKITGRGKGEGTGRVTTNNPRYRGGRQGPRFRLPRFRFGRQRQPSIDLDNMEVLGEWEHTGHAGNDGVTGTAAPTAPAPAPATGAGTAATDATAANRLSTASTASTVSRASALLEPFPPARDSMSTISTRSTSSRESGPALRPYNPRRGGVNLTGLDIYRMAMRYTRGGDN